MNNTNKDLEARHRRYFQLSTQLAHLDNEHLNALFAENEQTRGWGVNHTIELHGANIFVKKIPLTALEYENLFSTKNLYDLPTFYNYGVGSAGFGAFRELVTHIKTTNWVLAGEVENFPLMYHYRIVPNHKEPQPLEAEKYQRYVQYWNDDKNIEKFGIERRHAKYEIVLFLEYFPQDLWRWFGENLDKTESIIIEMRETISFLRKNGVIHFDVHFGNVVTDGTHFYLVDFGLILDKQFDLSEAERLFFNENSHYDYGELLFSIGSHIPDVYDDLSEAKKKEIASLIGLEDGMKDHKRFVCLLENIDAICAQGLMSLEASYIECVKRYKDIILLHDGFFADMRDNNKKDTKFENEKLKQLLHEGLLS